MRYDTIDFLKGIAIILMVIFHVFYFPNVYGYTEFKWDTPLLKIIAKIAQFIFITTAGINLYLAYHHKLEKDKIENIVENKIEYVKKHLSRTSKLIIIAILISISSYFVFGNMFVKFGILHFMAVSSLILLPFIDSQKILAFIIFIVLVLKYLANNYQSIFYIIPPKLAFISGFYNSYGSIDHFPLVPWLAVMCIGLLAGKVIINSDNKNLLLDDKDQKNIINEGIKWTGKNSLEIYVVHWIILYIVFALIYPKFRGHHH